MASTKLNSSNKDPDWTVGLLMGVKGGRYYILDVRRMRGSPGEVEDLIKTTAEADGRKTLIYIEQEPGSSGKIVSEHFIKSVLPGFAVYADPISGNKAERARPVSSQCQIENVYLCSGRWIPAFLDEVEVFPNGVHDDQVDALSGAFSKLVRRGLTVH